MLNFSKKFSSLHISCYFFPFLTSGNLEKSVSTELILKSYYSFKSIYGKKYYYVYRGLKNLPDHLVYACPLPPFYK